MLAFTVTTTPRKKMIAPVVQNGALADGLLLMSPTR